VDGGSAKPAGACEKPAGDPLESASATLWEGSKNYLAPGAERALSAFWCAWLRSEGAPNAHDNTQSDRAFSVRVVKCAFVTTTNAGCVLKNAHHLALAGCGVARGHWNAFPGQAHLCGVRLFGAWPSGWHPTK
jgi:hypothetical protein